MFFGHIGVGLAAKPVAPKAPLGALLFAITAAVPQPSTLTTIALVLLWPLGNWVDRHRIMTAAAVPRAAWLRKRNN